MNKSNTYLRFQTEIKFANSFIRDIDEIVFTSLIDKEDKLKELLRMDFDKDELITFILSQSVPSKRIDILSSIEIYLKENKGVSFEFNIK